MTHSEAKARLDKIIGKARTDLYKPIQVAETLQHSRLNETLDFEDLESYKNPSTHWRNKVTELLLGKKSTSSAQYQHNIWDDNAFPVEIMEMLNEENIRTKGGVERYIYLRFKERHETIGKVIGYISSATSETFQLEELLKFFVTIPGIKRSIDKAYEIVTYSLFETVVTALKATVTVEIPQEQIEILSEFSDLAKVLLGIDESESKMSMDAHIYRVGVTNAADRGLDMWANFGPAVQVKHLTINPKLAVSIIDQVESDYVVIVCKSSEREVIETVTSQLGWGKRVRGVVTESDLNAWYEKCLRGRFGSELGYLLIDLLEEGFAAEFPHYMELQKFLKKRGYDSEGEYSPWEL